MLVLFDFGPVVFEGLVDLLGLVVDAVEFQFVLPDVVFVHFDAFAELVVGEALGLLEDDSCVSHILKIF